MADDQVTLDSGYTKRHVDSVVYTNPTYDTVYHVEGVDTVAYLMPDAVQRVGIWGQPGPNGGPKPNYDNDFILYFETIAERDSAYEALSGRDEVLWVEKARSFAHFGVTPDDPLFSLQWGLENNSPVWSDLDIGAVHAWETTTGDQSVIIGVIDGDGVQLHHEDFRNTNGSWRTFGTSFWRGPHGTDVASIIGAATNNGIGMAGVDWKALIRVSYVGGTTPGVDPAQAAASTVFQVDNGTSILNHSYGDPEPDIVLAKAFVYAYNNDAVLVAAMGNNGGILANYPAAWPGVIAVGSLDKAGNKVPSSTEGDHIDLAAPSAEEEEDRNNWQIQTLQAGGGYRTTGWGTSLAAPHVAGCVGLLRSFAPNLSNDDVEHVLQLSALDRWITGHDRFTGYGLVKADSALALLKMPYTFYQREATNASVYSVSDLQYYEFWNKVDPSGQFMAKV